MPNFADRVWDIHLELLKLDPNATPSRVSNTALCHALSMEKTIDQHRYTESRAQLVRVNRALEADRIPENIKRFYPSDPASYPTDGQICRYAIYNPLSELNDVPEWMIGTGVWREELKGWGNLRIDGLGFVNALMFRCIYWNGDMSEEAFRAAMENPRFLV